MQLLSTSQGAPLTSDQEPHRHPEMTMTVLMSLEDIRVHVLNRRWGSHVGCMQITSWDKQRTCLVVSEGRSPSLVSRYTLCPQLRWLPQDYPSAPADARALAAQDSFLPC